MNRSGLASLTVLTSLVSFGTALAQDVPPPPPPPPAAPPPAAAEPAPPPAPPPPIGASATAAASTSGEADLNVDASAGAAQGAKGEAEEDPNAERAYRLRSLHETNSLNGSTGLMRVVQASSGAPGTF